MAHVPSEAISIPFPSSPLSRRKRVGSQNLELANILPARVQVPWSVDIRLDRPILKDALYLIVASPLIEGAFGNAIDAPPNDRGSAPGDMPIQSRIPARPMVTTEGVDIAFDPFQGVFLLDTRGDYTTQDEDAALKKRILRRLSSRKGGFFHLADYGLGIKLKHLLKTTQRAKLRNEIIRQIKQEEDVESVSVEVTIVPARGILEVGIKVRSRRQTNIAITLRIPEDGPIVVS